MKILYDQDGIRTVLHHTVLLVEDDPHFLAECERGLRGLGWIVRSATSVSEAKTTIESASISVVLTDMDLGFGYPEGGLSIVDFCQQMRVPVACHSLVDRDVPCPFRLKSADSEATSLWLLDVIKSSPVNFKLISQISSQVRGDHVRISVWERGALAGTLEVRQENAGAIIQRLAGPETVLMLTEDRGATLSAKKPNKIQAADIVAAAGGQVVGQTRLQKLAYLLELTGLGDGFVFENTYPYGPHSEELTSAIGAAKAYGMVREEERTTTWGGVYSVYTTDPYASGIAEEKAALAQAVTKIGPIELELLATAAYLWTRERHPDPWRETALRKPEKAAGGRLDQARAAYRELQKIKTPVPLPQIA